jgi:cytochrome c oxidase assembly protein subunit 15
MVLVQGWLGGQVVKTGLNAWLITLHMFLAMFIMMALIYAAYKASEEQISTDILNIKSDWFLGALLLLMVCTFAQLILGTQVREAIDALKNMVNAPPRETWISHIDLIDKIHRSFAWTVLLSGGAVFYFAGWKANSKIIRRIGLTIFGLILLQIVTGVGIYYLGVPPTYQVIHLTGIAFLIGFEFLLFLLVMRSREDLPSL